jgi:SpoVK/Ycf46/Vps4 family AAA+-type ATPase
MSPKTLRAFQREKLDEIASFWTTQKTQKATGRVNATCLFTGPSGTGKTMAAQVLAKRLDLPLYRIDLSAVVSKYIGETEKNLKQLFDAAEVSDVILLFDEADALFGKRTEVRDAHDRYGNLSIHYLLGRMERSRGLMILAVRRKDNIDPAFLRRTRFIIKFPHAFLRKEDKDE